MYFVYVLKSLKIGKFYKGQTNNLKKRLHQHFTGQSIATKSLLPLELVFVQLVKTRAEAILIEKFLKSGSGRDFINFVA